MSEAEESFWRRYEKRHIPEPNSGCFLWLGAVSGTRHEKHGRYGRMRYGDGVYNVTRILWGIARGPIPDGMVIMHRCDNAYCVNIDHLRLGTASENSLDMHRKNRHKIRARRRSANVQ